MAFQQFGSQSTFGGFGTTSQTGSVGFGNQNMSTFGGGGTTPFGSTTGGSAFGAQAAPQTPSVGLQPQTNNSAPLFGSAPTQTPTFGQQSQQSALVQSKGFGGFGNVRKSSAILNRGDADLMLLPQVQQSQATAGFGGMTSGFLQPQQPLAQQAAIGTASVPFRPVEENQSDQSNRSLQTKLIYNSITAMPQYSAKSFEELRFEDYKAGNKGRPGGFGGATPFTNSSFGSASSGFGGNAASAFGQFGASNNTGKPTAFGSAQPSFSSTAPFGGSMSQNQQAGSLFGTTNSTGTQNSLFGGSSSAQTSFGGFGQAANNSNATPFGGGSAFGSTANKPGGYSFGTGGAPSFGQPQTAGFGFGSSTSGTTGFGQSAPGQSQPGSGLFGTQTPAPAPASMFGTSTGSSFFQGQQGTSLFGSTQNKPNTLFGSQPQQASTMPGLGSAPTFGQGTSLFGSTTGSSVPGQQSTSSLFNMTSTTSPAFGAAGTGVNPSTGITTGGLFSGGTNTLTTSNQPSGSMFGGGPTTGFSAGNSVLGQTPGSTGGFFGSGGSSLGGGLGLTSGFGNPTSSTNLYNTGNNQLGGGFGGKPLYGAQSISNFGSGMSPSGGTTSGLFSAQNSSGLTAQAGPTQGQATFSMGSTFQSPLTSPLSGGLSFGAPQQPAAQQPNVSHPFGPGISEAQSRVQALNRRGAELESKYSKKAVGVSESEALAMGGTGPSIGGVGQTGAPVTPVGPRGFFGHSPATTTSPSEGAIAEALSRRRRIESRAQIVLRSKTGSIGRSTRASHTLNTGRADTSAPLIESIKRHRLVIDPKVHSAHSAGRLAATPVLPVADDEENGPAATPRRLNIAAEPEQSGEPWQRVDEQSAGNMNKGAGVGTTLTASRASSASRRASDSLLYRAPNPPSSDVMQVSGRAARTPARQLSFNAERTPGLPHSSDAGDPPMSSLPTDVSTGGPATASNAATRRLPTSRSLTVNEDPTEDGGDSQDSHINATTRKQPNPNAPILTKLGYVTQPPLEELQTMTDDQLKAVNGFAVIRPEVGRIKWLGSVDVRGVNLDRDVRICESEGPPGIEVYDDDESKPPRNQKLNGPAIVTLENVGPSSDADASQPGAAEKWTRKIEKAVKRMKCELVQYDFGNRIWEFKCKHM